MARLVYCVKFQRELPGLDAPPFPGELGQRIYDHVSQEAWALWPRQATILINHYGLNMGDPAARDWLTEQMEEFYFGADAPMPEGWVPQGGGGAKAAKGGGGAAPRRK